MFRSFQSQPRLLEMAFDAMHSLLCPFRRWLKPGGAVEWLFVRGEEVAKGAVFDCRMCGQCILHTCGMICPMTCPKNLRNGPCGGVDSHECCEILPDMRCVWVEAWERSRRMQTYGDEILHLMPPLNRKLEGTSAWINDFTGVAAATPSGWTD